MADNGAFSNIKRTVKKNFGDAMERGPDYSGNIRKQFMDSTPPPPVEQPAPPSLDLPSNYDAGTRQRALGITPNSMQDHTDAMSQQRHKDAQDSVNADQAYEMVHRGDPSALDDDYQRQKAAHIKALQQLTNGYDY